MINRKKSLFLQVLKKEIENKGSPPPKKIVSLTPNDILKDSAIKDKILRISQKTKEKQKEKDRFNRLVSKEKIFIVSDSEQDIQSNSENDDGYLEKLGKQQ